MAETSLLWDVEPYMLLCEPRRYLVSVANLLRAPIPLPQLVRRMDHNELPRFLVKVSYYVEPSINQRIRLM
jgi:hypothetical protein